MALSPVDSLVIQLIDAIRVQVLSELKGMSLNDLLKVSGGAGVSASAPAAARGPGRPKKAASVKKAAAPRPGKRLRRTADDIKRVATKINALLGDHGDGLSSEDIQKALGLAKKEITGPIALALSEGTITKTGDRRGTKYFAKAAAGGRGRKKGD